MGETRRIACPSCASEDIAFDTTYGQFVCQSCRAIIKPGEAYVFGQSSTDVAKVAASLAQALNVKPNDIHIPEPLKAKAKAKTHTVLLIHGIRTQAEWAQRAASVLESDPTIRVVFVRYEFFDSVRFLLPIPGLRRKPIRRVLAILRDELSRRPEKLSIIAHSFGTYIVSRILEEEPDIEIYRLVLCGSIIPDSYQWERYKYRIGRDREGDYAIVNDCGISDVWPVFSKYVWGCGSSGRFGFGHGRVKDRFHPFGHSGFFDEAVIRKYWLSFLQGRLEEGEIDRPKTPWWISVLTVPVTRYAVFSVVVLVAFAFLGIRFSREDVLEKPRSLPSSSPSVAASPSTESVRGREAVSPIVMPSPLHRSSQSEIEKSQPPLKKRKASPGKQRSVPAVSSSTGPSVADQGKRAIEGGSAPKAEETIADLSTESSYNTFRHPRFPKEESSIADEGEILTERHIRSPQFGPSLADQEKGAADGRSAPKVEGSTVEQEKKAKSASVPYTAYATLHEAFSEILRAAFYEYNDIRGAVKRQGEHYVSYKSVTFPGASSCEVMVWYDSPGAGPQLWCTIFTPLNENEGRSRYQEWKENINSSVSPNWRKKEFSYENSTRYEVHDEQGRLRLFLIWMDRESKYQKFELKFPSIQLSPGF